MDAALALITSTLIVTQMLCLLLRLVISMEQSFMDQPLCHRLLEVVTGLLLDVESASRCQLKEAPLS